MLQVAQKKSQKAQIYVAWRIELQVEAELVFLVEEGGCVYVCVCGRKEDVN